MANPEKINYLSSDKALKDPKQDRLGYKHFAEHLSKHIWKMAPPEGFVIAIYGPWGSGKSSMLNFLEYYIKQMPPSEQPIIVHFNPWWFSGHEDLTIRFFGQLQAALLSNGVRTIDSKNLKKNLAKFTRLVAKTPIPDASLKAILFFGGNIISDILSGKEDIVKLKDRIANDLAKLNRKILVIIDDIDRLTDEEIRQLFRVIKAIADFPNVIYLLSFDKHIVLKSLEGVQGKTRLNTTQDNSGEAYLEKIIQLPFELPLPDKIALQEILRDKLEVILSDTPEELIDDRYRSDAYLRHIGNFIDTPRDIIRLINTLRVTYPSVKGEVNFVDFILIETLRVFIPISYDVIRRNPERFIGSNAGYLGGSFVERNNDFHNGWIMDVKENDQAPVKILIVDIFPLLAAIWGGSNYRPEDWGTTWRKQRRVCVQDLFHIYFMLIPPQSIMPLSEIKHLISLSYNSNVFAVKLLDLAKQKRPDGITRAYEFLWRLEDYTKEEIPEENISEILKAFFDIGDDLLISEELGTEGISRINIQIGRIIWLLLRRVDEPRRFDILKRSMSEGRAVSTIIHEVVVIGQEHGKHGADKNKSDDAAIISLEHLNILENIALLKIRDAALNSYLLKKPDLPLLLYIWQELSGEEEAKNWVEGVISDDDGLILLLDSFLFIGYSRDLTSGHKSKIYRNDPRRIEHYLDLSQIIGRARKLVLNGELTEHQRIALKQFIGEYEIIKQGKDPDNPWVRSTWKRE